MSLTDTYKRIPLNWRDNSEFYRKLVIYVLVSLAVVMMTFPMVWMLLSSLKPTANIFSTPPTVIPDEVTLRHYIRVWNETDYTTFLINSLIVALVTSLVTTIAATMAGYSLTRFQFRGRDRLARSILVLYLLPPIMFVVPLFIIFKQLGLNNTLTAVALGHITYALPFSIWLLRAFFASLPTTYEEAAMCEGASRVRAITDVVLPLSLPGVMTVALFSFTVSWNDYLFALTFISSNENQTVTLALSSYASAQGVEWGLLSAICILISIPPLFAIIFIKKHLLKGFGIAG